MLTSSSDLRHQFFCRDTCQQCPNMTFSISGGGRQYKRVNYATFDQPEDPINNSRVAYSRPSNKLILKFDSPVSNTLSDAIKAGYKPDIPTGSYLILSINAISKIDNSYYLTGQYATISNQNKVISVSATYDADTQPAPLVTEILSIVKDISPQRDISNDLYDKITKNMSLPLNYLKYNIGDTVLLRPSPTYSNNGIKQYFDPIQYVDMFHMIDYYQQFYLLYVLIL